MSYFLQSHMFRAAIEIIIDAINFFPPPVIIIFVSMLPIAELRVSLPLAICVYNIPILPAYILAVVGNILPVPFILLLLKKVELYLTRYKRWKIFFEKLYEKVRKKSVKSIKKWGYLALIPFVAIPFPVTGAWTGSLIAYLFNFKFKYALLVIFIGVLLAGFIVLSIILGILIF